MGSSLRRFAFVSPVYAVIGAAVSYFFLGFNLFFIGGLLLGCFLAFFKAMMWGKLPVLLARASGKRTGIAVSLSIGVQLFTGVILFASALIDTRFFFGLSLGLVSTVVGAITFIGAKKDEETNKS